MKIFETNKDVVILKLDGTYLACEQSPLYLIKNNFSSMKIKD